MNKDSINNGKVNPENQKPQNGISRRDFLKAGTAGLGSAGLLWSMPGSMFFLKGIPGIENPLTHYPNRIGKRSTATNTNLTILSLLSVLPIVPTNAECGASNAMAL